MAELEGRGAGAQRLAFEQALQSSQAVITRELGEFLRLAMSADEVFSTFYKLIEADVRFPSGGKWDAVRALTDDALFPGYKDQIRFGALSLTSRGLDNYGECSLVLRDRMVSHRATVFEENSVVWMDKHGIRIADAADLPAGYRALWEERGKLAVAKLGKLVAEDTSATAFSDLVKRDGADTASDEFIEVHIYGP